VRPGDALIVDTQGQAARYFSRACGAWMVARKVALVAATLAKYDTGFVNSTGVFMEWFEAGIPILAEIENVERIAHERVFLIVMPMKIERVCTAPCRALVLDGEAEEVEAAVSLVGRR
jgi:kynurenine formamidase